MVRIDIAITFLKGSQTGDIGSDNDHRLSRMFNGIHPPGAVKSLVGFGPLINDLHLLYSEVTIEVVNSKLQCRQRQFGILKMRLANGDNIVNPITIYVSHVHINGPRNKILLPEKGFLPKESPGQAAGMVWVQIANISSGKVEFY